MKNNFLIKLKNCLTYLIFLTQLKIIAIGNKRALRKRRPTSDSEISLRDVALNFSPAGNITRIMRLRSLADFSTQIRLRRTSHNPDVSYNKNSATLHPFTSFWENYFIIIKIKSKIIFSYFSALLRKCSTTLRSHSASKSFTDCSIQGN